jgi:hypothetical protein
MPTKSNTNIVFVGTFTIIRTYNMTDETAETLDNNTFGNKWVTCIRGASNSNRAKIYLSKFKRKFQEPFKSVEGNTKLNISV